MKYIITKWNIIIKCSKDLTGDIRVRLADEFNLDCIEDRLRLVEICGRRYWIYTRDGNDKLEPGESTLPYNAIKKWQQEEFDEWVRSAARGWQEIDFRKEKTLLHELLNRRPDLLIKERFTYQPLQEAFIKCATFRNKVIYHPRAADLVGAYKKICHRYGCPVFGLD